jgi:ABC-type multidrug transport system fused ATPase/permease subunit
MSHSLGKDLAAVELREVPSRSPTSNPFDTTSDLGDIVPSASLALDRTELRKHNDGLANRRVQPCDISVKNLKVVFKTTKPSRWAAKPLRSLRPSSDVEAASSTTGTTLLNDISAYIKAGTLTAILGGSGIGS